MSGSVRIPADPPDSCSWVNKMVARRNKNIAAVALANKNARTVWALLVHDREYQMDYQSVAR